MRHGTPETVNSFQENAYSSNSGSKIPSEASKRPLWRIPGYLTRLKRCRPWTQPHGTNLQCNAKRKSCITFDKSKPDLSEMAERARTCTNIVINGRPQKTSPVQTLRMLVPVGPDTSTEYKTQCDSGESRLSLMFNIEMGVPSNSRGSASRIPA